MHEFQIMLHLSTKDLWKHIVEAKGLLRSREKQTDYFQDFPGGMMCSVTL